MFSIHEIDRVQTRMLLFAFIGDQNYGGWDVSIESEAAAGMSNIQLLDCHS